MRRTFKNWRLCMLWPAALVLAPACERGGSGTDSAAEEEDVQEETDTVQEEVAETSYYQEDTAGLSVETSSQSGYTQEAEKEGKRWYIIISSMPTREKAEHFAERRSPGSEVVYIDYLDTYRVVHSSYNDLKAAQTGYESLRNDFPDAWMVRF